MPAGETEGTLGVDLGRLGLERGGQILLKRALRGVSPGGAVTVRGTHEGLGVQLRAWCRMTGQDFEAPSSGGNPSFAGRVIRNTDIDGRRVRAERAGGSDPVIAGAVTDRPSLRWGLAARGALVEAGGPDFDFTIDEKTTVWADEAAAIYAQAAAAQWDPNSAIDWNAPFEIPDEIEDAVVQVMTYLIENEVAALIVPSRFLGRIHPHFREVLQVLAIQAADEARHIEVFTKRARLRRDLLGLSTVGGQRSLKTLLDEPDFALASFLLSVLGEGSFLSLLGFLAEYGPDPVTRQITLMAARDEARHVAFGLAHLRRQIGIDPTIRSRLAAAVERRHDALRHTAGLNEEVFDALVLIAAGSWAPEEIGNGFDRVVALTREMDQGRRHRLLPAGLPRGGSGRALQPAHPQLHVGGGPKGDSGYERGSGGKRVAVAGRDRPAQAFSSPA